MIKLNYKVLNNNLVFKNIYNSNIINNLIMLICHNNINKILIILIKLYKELPNNKI